MIKDIIVTNFANNKNLDKIIQAIKFNLTQLPHIPTILPKTWVRVRKVLEEDERNYISLEDYLSICDKNGFKKQENALEKGFIEAE